MQDNVFLDLDEEKSLRMGLLTDNCLSEEPRQRRAIAICPFRGLSSAAVSSDHCPRQPIKLVEYFQFGTEQ